MPVKLEAANAVTSFIRPKISDELAQAERYYIKTFPQGTAPAQNIGYPGSLCLFAPDTTAAGYGVMWVFPVTMRASPTVTSYSPNAATANWYDITHAAAGGTAVVDTSTTSKSTTGVMIGSSTTGANAIGDQICIQATADARL